MAEHTSRFLDEKLKEVFCQIKIVLILFTTDRNKTKTVYYEKVSVKQILYQPSPTIVDVMQEIV